MMGERVWREHRGNPDCMHPNGHMQSVHERLRTSVGSNLWLHLSLRRKIVLVPRKCNHNIGHPLPLQFSNPVLGTVEGFLAKKEHRNG
jgi:hypothetical protein